MTALAKPAETWLQGREKNRRDHKWKRMTKAVCLLKRESG